MANDTGGVLRIAPGAVFDQMTFTDTMFVGSGGTFTNCRFVHCDLSQVTDGEFLCCVLTNGCAPPPMDFVLEVRLPRAGETS